ncbi:hypothetical protein [Lysinibacillus sphaericus]|uniref:Transposase n=1 Tax=Lysinibacillus sphaericus OT4b.31 TaxID=1285586 RepID=R7ZI34_LYSSH|nr:hypothetical protein [Lysinibacillus sphaericus]EON73743.1 transposase [Lysinibacillus sphaericus OT4b.31]
MTKNSNNELHRLEMLTVDQMMPEEHLVRKLEAALDFIVIYPLCEEDIHPLEYYSRQ